MSFVPVLGDFFSFTNSLYYRYEDLCKFLLIFLQNFISHICGSIPVFRCVRISIRGLVRRSVGPLVGRSVMLSSKSMKNWLIWILNDLDSAGRGGRRDEEEGGTRRKEERGGRRDERKKGRGEWKNEKVAKKWKMKKSLKDASLASLGLVRMHLSSS